MDKEKLRKANNLQNKINNCEKCLKDISALYPTAERYVKQGSGSRHSYRVNARRMLDVLEYMQDRMSLSDDEILDIHNYVMTFAKLTQGFLLERKNEAEKKLKDL